VPHFRKRTGPTESALSALLSEFRAWRKRHDESCTTSLRIMGDGSGLIEDEVDSVLAEWESDPSGQTIMRVLRG